MLLKIAVAGGRGSGRARRSPSIGEAGEDVPDAGRGRSRRRPRRRRAAAGAGAEPEPQRRRGGAATGRGRRRRATGQASRVRPRVKASPLARRIARERGIELATRDRHRARRAHRRRGRRARAGRRRPRRRPAAGCRRPASSSRSRSRASARRSRAGSTAAWQVPVFQLTVSADMTRANALVERSRELDPDVRVTVTDLLAKVCARALHAPPRRERPATPTRRCCASRRRTSASPSPRRRASSCRSSARSSGSRSPRSPRREPTLVDRARERQAAAPATSRAAPSRSRTSACSASSSSSPCSTRRRRRSSRSARPSSSRSCATARSSSGPMMTVTLTVDHRAVDGAPGGRLPAHRQALPRRSSARPVTLDPVRNADGRPGRGDKLDVPFLRSLLAHAYNWHVAGFDTRHLDLALRRRLGTAGRHGADRDGRAAIRSARAGSGSSAPRRPGYGFVDEDDARADDRRRPGPAGRGDRQELLAALLERAQQAGYPALSVVECQARPSPTSEYLRRGLRAGGRRARRARAQRSRGERRPAVREPRVESTRRTPGRSRGRSATRGRARRRPPPRAVAARARPNSTGITGS